MEVEPVWLWPSEEVWNDLATGDFSQPYGSFTDTANHGSCMVSKVAGFSWGVAKKAAVVVVKLITGSTEANLGDILQSSPLTALAMVQNDIMARSAANVPVNGKVIVNMSFGLNYDPGDPGDRFWIREYEIAIRNLLALDVVLVTTAGNHRVSTLANHDQRKQIDHNRASQVVPTMSTIIPPSSPAYTRI